MAEPIEKLFDIFFRNESYCFLIAYPQDNLCHWTKNCPNIFALDAQSTPLEEAWETLLHPDDKSRFSAGFHALADGHAKEHSGMFRFLRRLGTYQEYQCNFYAVSGSGTGSGSGPLPSRIVGMLTDPDGTGMLDPVTALPSNLDFHRTLGHQIASGRTCGLMALDIDNFKVFNETNSYAFGNRVLCECAAILCKILPRGCSLFRSDGDGFYALFDHTGMSDLAAWYQKAQDAVSNTVSIDGHPVCFTLSAGACLYPEDGVTVQHLYRNVTLALRSSKRGGKSRMTVYSEDLSGDLEYQPALLSALRESVMRGFGPFEMHYQPIMDNQGALAGCEALLRFNHPDFPGVPIQACISLLENSGLMCALGDWILETAISQCAAWQKLDPDFSMNINVSCQQFEKPDFKFHVLQLIHRSGADPSHITLELTESGEVKDLDSLKDIFDFLRSQRIQIAFDDFGTGYASLNVFRRLSVDELKIDRTFLERITYDVTDQSLLTMLINLCHSINMTVCVEGIENQEVESLIRQIQPDYFQGYYYSPPLPAGSFEETYFRDHAEIAQSQREQVTLPEFSNSLVYAPLCPAQPLALEDLVNFAYAGIFQVGMDEEFTFLSCNEGYRRMLGYTAAEIEQEFSNRALGFVHPDDTAYVNQEIRRQLAEGDTVTIEFRIVRKDQSSIWILGTGNVYNAPDGSRSLIVVIINNDRSKRAQLERLRQYRVYKKMLDNLPVGFKLVRYDADFTIDYISPGFLNIVGYTEEEIQTHFHGKYINLIYPDDRENVFSDIAEQLKTSNIVTMRYRTPCKNGTLLWVETVSRLCLPDEDGIQRACSCVTAISQSSADDPQASHQGLKIANRYELAATQWGELLFELNFKTDTLTLSKNFQRIFGIGSPISTLDATNLIFPTDREALRQAIGQCRGGGVPCPMDLRLCMPDGTYRWFALVFSEPEQLSSIPISVIGKFTDIDKEKREREQLVRQARHDPLTGILNKGTTESQIRRMIAEQPDASFALFMIDIDHFKQVNDTLGHFSGDELLHRLAAILRSQIRCTDIIGRVGGDEFMVFLPFDGHKRSILGKAAQIMEAVRESQLLQVSGYSPEDPQCPSPTISMGIAVYPDNGKDFYELFRRADSALYRSKKLGKNQFCLAN